MFELQEWFKQNYVGGRLSWFAVKKFLKQRNCEVAKLMQDLLPIAQSYALPVISQFSVGAVALGTSGAIYLGANQEFPYQPLPFTLHAEQVAVIMARHHQEKNITKIVIDYPPCGFCRQFLLEVCPQKDLLIHLKVGLVFTLDELIPCSFSADDLNITTSFWSKTANTAQFENLSPFIKSGENPCFPSEPSLINAALDAYKKSYAPYSKAYCGIALQLENGLIFQGSYLENAAFNPSILPLSAALCLLRMQNIRYQAISEACLVQPVNAIIDQAQMAKMVLASLVPDARFYVMRVS